MSNEGIQELRARLAEQNLERLSAFEPPEAPTESTTAATCSLALSLLEQWTKDHKAAIQHAVEESALGKDKLNIDWQITFLAFMESTAVYLRDWGAVYQSWRQYRELKMTTSLVDPQIKHDIFKRYQDSELQIRQLAQMWGLDFVVLVDLVDLAPKVPDRPLWDGPYLGAFFTTTAQKENQFIGLAFKGTNPLRLPEGLVDYNYQLTSSSQWLNDNRVSTGVATGLFGKFQQPYDIAYNFILTSVSALASTLQKQRPSDTSSTLAPIITHVTGHSLGGSYSTMCFAQLLVNTSTVGGPDSVVIGDEYTFGAPRVGDKAWAQWYRDGVNKARGASWRIVNSNDLVPQVPPTTLKPQQLQFCHVDAGMQIFPDKTAVVIASEIPEEYPPPYNIGSLKDLIQAVIDTNAHIPIFYYKSLEYMLGNVSM